MIAISTNLRPGTTEDFDQLRVEVFKNGERFRVKDFKDLGQPGLTTFPATFTIDAPDEELDQDFLFRVSGRRAGRDAEAVVQEVVTRVPRDRTALLWMPIEWSCLGSGNHTQAEDYTHGTCPEGQRCVAGSCVAWAVEASALPDFTSRAVFGDRSCLDTFACFEGATVVPLPAPGDCTIPLPPGASNVNVALVTKSRGICAEDKPGYCLAPLDHESLDAFGASGFFVDGDSIRLSPGICDPACPMREQVGDQVLGVAISTACPTKTRSVGLCGPWSTDDSQWTPTGTALDGAGGATPLDACAGGGVGGAGGAGGQGGG